MRIMLTAGFDRAQNVISLVELLRRDGHEVAGIIVVSPYSIKRLRSLVRRCGKKVIIQSARRLLGLNQPLNAGSPMEIFLERNGIAFRSLKKWSSANNVPYYVTASLNAAKTIRIIRQTSPRVVIYGGGGILRSPFIEAAGRRIINAHCGPLPQIRGMNACEWSILLDIPPAVTIHFIDEGIDTGPVIETIPVPVEPGETIERMRMKCVVVGVEALRRAVSSVSTLKSAVVEKPDCCRQCFVMAPAVREIVERKLANLTSVAKSSHDDAAYRSIMAFSSPHTN